MAKNPSGLTLLIRSVFGFGGGETILHDLGISRNSNRSVRIKYKTRGGGTRERVVDVYSVGNGYVDAHDHFRGEMRTFKVGRIQWTELTQDRFETASGHSPSGWVKSGWGEIRS